MKNHLIIKENKIKNLSINFAITIMFVTEFFCYTLPGLGILSFFRIYYIMSAFSFFLFVIYFVHYKKYLVKKRLLFYYIYLITIMLMVLFSVFFNDKCTYEISSILCSFLLPVLLITSKFDIEKVLKYILLCSIVILPGYSIIFAYQWEVLNQANMGAIYSVYTIVAASLLHFVYFRKNYNKYFYVLYIPSLVGCVGILMYGNRGAILSILVLITILLFNRNNDFQIKNHYIGLRKKIVFFLSIVLIAFALSNMNTIFYYLYNIADSIFDELPSFFVKMNKYMNLNDLSNGRSDLNILTNSLIEKKKYLGYGIGTYPSYTGYSYPHSFYLQLWFEGGIFSTIIPVIVSLYASYKVFLSRIYNKNCAITLFFLFSQVFPRFLLSSDIWLDKFFWVFIFYVIYNFKSFSSKDYIERGNV